MKRTEAKRRAADGKRQILAWIEEDRDRIIGFVADFVRIASPNPPGDTRAAREFVAKFLDEQGLDYRVVDPEPTMPNIIAAFDGEAGLGRHLVLNGHIDVFPVGDRQGWTKDCWGGEVSKGRIWGRGACDMKSGTTASIFSYVYLARLRERLAGRLTLTVVSDEETFGEWGSRYLVANHPEVLGDCCLNAEPSSRHTIRFGEKGFIWLRFHVNTSGGHSAYPHLGASATKLAARLIVSLEKLRDLRPDMPGNVAAAIERGRPAIEAGLGRGATDIMAGVTTNVGTITGGA
ncbi:M20/M25/M40 family metallo-hydrolase [Bradyrhizobium sp. CCBAU 51765]|uniref:M20/M25/M40 family metallo-hydrolase n=1 Tax=Bradyrhizobium sp. CCBAU 51765 TaxID=1325102 RepID=UPI001FEE29F2|nr:M20/M25/M40 family metallo-hydrolase [Bradyrhizobium sp. CCBAU 51765]